MWRFIHLSALTHWSVTRLIQFCIFEEWNLSMKSYIMNLYLSKPMENLHLCHFWSSLYKMFQKRNNFKKVKFLIFCTPSLFKDLEDLIWHFISHFSCNLLLLSSLFQSTIPTFFFLVGVTMIEKLAFSEMLYSLNLKKLLWHVCSQL